MKKFLYKIIIYLFIALFIGEVIVRFFYLNSEIPEREIINNIQVYKPNQSGYWKGGKHKWNINEHGWASSEPKSSLNLITIIGDSFIENFMNPQDCHQRELLTERISNVNFLEAGRSGVSLIEAMEISKTIESEFDPLYHMVYVSDSDFKESIANIARETSITQLDLKKEKLVYAKLKAPLLKKILYNWKFIYYLYSRFPIKLFEPKSGFPKPIIKKEKDYLNEYQILLDFIKLKHDTEKIIFVLRPKVSNPLFELIKKNNIKYIRLRKPKNEKWSFEDDHHWNCFGHEQAADQISKELPNIVNLP